jgi:MoaA/NifB/PqqE/SkfB family radical SAM enzyme
MAINGLHLLLTYKCNFGCDHCFLWGGPEAEGVMPMEMVRGILDDAVAAGTIEKIFFEGGEPFLYYPVMLRGIREASGFGFKTGVVTNAYWATTIQDAILWLRPLAEFECDLSISDDCYHFGEKAPNPRNAAAAAEELGIQASLLSTADPRESLEAKRKGGPVMFKGRAVEKLTPGLPRRPWEELSRCPYEDFLNQRRVHIDPFGYVHVCQGIAIGNVLREPLSAVLEGFDPQAHPICSPIVTGGPAELVRRHDIQPEEGYVDECHLCYIARQELRHQYPELLGPDQMYGVQSEP